MKTLWTAGGPLCCVHSLEGTRVPAFETRSLAVSSTLHPHLLVWRALYWAQHCFAKNSAKIQHLLCSKCQSQPRPFWWIFVWDTHLSRKQGIGVELLHFSHQIVCGERYILHKLAVQQEPIGAAIHSNALWDPPVSQAPHVGITLQEEPVQALFPDEPERHREAISPKMPPPRVQIRWHNPSSQSIYGALTVCQAPSQGSVWMLSLGLHGETGLR